MLRPYQEESIKLVQKEFASGNRKTCLVLPTGAGKSVIACDMIKKSVSNGKRVIFIVKGVALIDQISRRLFKELVPHGVMQANHWNRRPTAPVQAISIDTAVARDIFTPADFIIIDECDQATSDGYKLFLSKYPNAFILGITATPYTKGGLRHIADSIVRPISMLKLIEDGFLVPFKYYAPTVPDLTDVKVSSTGDYMSDQLEGAMVAGQLTGKIVDHWIKLAQNRPTLIFAVNVSHSKHLTAQFCERGIPCAHVDAKTPQDERDRVFKELQSGALKAVSNVGIATRGFDAPFISCLVVARPTRTLNLHIQMLGRGTRLSEGKSDCIVLDHAGNLISLGLPTDEPEVNLDGDKIEKSVKETKICKNCFCAYRASHCPECGRVEPEQNEADIEESDDELKELNIETDPVFREFKRLQKEADLKDKKPDWARYKLIDNFGFEKASKYFTEAWNDRYKSNLENPFKKSKFQSRRLR